MRQATRFLLVLHGHIPDVMGHGTWPHGANWIYEAAAETYLPFLRMARRLGCQPHRPPASQRLPCGRNLPTNSSSASPWTVIRRRTTVAPNVS